MTVRLSEEELQRLEGLAKALRKRVSELAREAIVAALLVEGGPR